MGNRKLKWSLDLLSTFFPLDLPRKSNLSHPYQSHKILSSRNLHIHSSNHRGRFPLCFLFFLDSPYTRRTKNHPVLLPVVSLVFASSLGKCGKINCELWNSVHSRPPLCIFTLRLGCLRVPTRKEGRSTGRRRTVNTHYEARIVQTECTVITAFTSAFYG